MGVAAQGYLVIDGDRLYVPTGRGVPAVFERTQGKFLSLNLQPNTNLGGADVVGVGDWFFNSGAVFDAASQTPIAHRARRRPASGLRRPFQEQAWPRGIGFRPKTTAASVRAVG